MFSVKVIACVLIALCGAFLTVPSAFFAVDSVMNNQHATAAIFIVSTIVGLMAIYSAVVWFYSLAYDKGVEDGIISVVNRPTLEEMIKAAEDEPFVPIHDSMTSPAVNLENEIDLSRKQPLVKLGQGDYEKHFYFSDD